MWYALEFDRCTGVNGPRARGRALEYAHHAGPMFGVGFWAGLPCANDARLRRSRAGGVPRRAALAAAVAVATTCVRAGTPSASASGFARRSATLFVHSAGCSGGANFFSAGQHENRTSAQGRRTTSSAETGTRFAIRRAALAILHAAVVGSWYTATDGVARFDSDRRVRGGRCFFALSERAVSSERGASGRLRGRKFPGHWGSSRRRWNSGNRFGAPRMPSANRAGSPG